MDPAQYLTIKELFEKRFFEIPDYQRGYSWGAENVEDLLEDILRTQKRRIPHYTGTVVARANANFTKFEVVDGQQRLTTIVLIMTRLVDRLPEHDANEVRNRFIFRGEAGNEQLVLTPNSEIREYFQSRVLDNDENAPARVAGHHAIDTALTVIEKWMSSEEFSPKDFLETIEKQLSALLFVPPSNQEAGAMFEVINNRGVGLSQLQMVKNYLLYFATMHGRSKLRERINDTWQDLLRDLDIAHIDKADEEDQFLRNCYLVFFDPNKSKSWYSYAQIKEWYPVDTSDVDETTKLFSLFVQFLAKAARSIAALSDHATAKNYFPNDDVCLQLKRLRCHPSLASFLPMIIAATVSITDYERLSQLLSLIERVNFRVYLLPKVTNRSDSGQGQLFYWAYYLYNEEITVSSLENDLIVWARSHSLVKTVAEHLTLDDGETEDYYVWPALRYFLARYEDHLQNQHNDVFQIEQILERRADSPTGRYLSVEHIWAQKNREESYPEDYVTKRRLGNLVLLGLNDNIRASADDIEDKVERLIDHAKHGIKLDQVFEIKEILKKAKRYPQYKKYKRRFDGMYAVLAAAIADMRENKLIRFALEQWALPGDDPSQFVKVDSLSDPSRKAVCWFRDDDA